MFSFQLQPPGFMCAYYVGVLLTIVSPCICGSQFNTCFWILMHIRRVATLS